MTGAAATDVINNYNACTGEDGNLSLNPQCLTPSGPPLVTVWAVLLALLLSGFILAVIVGNIYVILAVALFREMRTLTNGLIVSLASADILVAIIVMPISLHNEMMKGYWTLGQWVCDFWITSDVFCCTASILNIVVIAVDRYWLITRNVRYTHNTTFGRKRACICMVMLAWMLSGLISASPLFGWKTGKERADPAACLISQDLTYTVFSTFGAFWFPLFVILIVYLKIFRIARRRAIIRAKARAIHPSVQSTVMTEMNGKATRACARASDSGSPPGSPSRNLEAPLNGEARNQRNGRTSRGSRQKFRSRTRNSARTLGLIIGGFVFCWLPFFVIATIMPFCSVCQGELPAFVPSVVLWLGYSNSLINPAIYAIWDKNFRRSFRRLTHCDVRWSNVL